jgi:hypothetical protein
MKKMGWRNDKRNRLGERKRPPAVLGFFSLPFAALVLLISCSNPFETPAPAPIAPGMGRAVISLGGGGSRTLMPETPVFAKYTLAFAAPGKATVSEDLTETGAINSLEGTGYGVDLEPGTWALIVTAYTRLDPASSYLEAAKNTTPVAVSIDPGASVEVAATIDPLPVNGTMKGIFSWDIDLSGLGSVDSAELIYAMQGGPAVTKDLKTAASGAAELDSGRYVVTILLDKGGQTAGRTEGAHIYPGLTTRAGKDRPEFTVFTDADFVDMKYLAGTAAVVKPGSLTLGPISVGAYADLACAIPIVTDPVSAAVSGGGQWSMKIPATLGDVYLRLETSGSGGGRSFNAAAVYESGVPDNGKPGITLSMTIYALSQTITGPGTVGITVDGQTGAYAMEGETIALTVSPSPGYGLKPGTLRGNGGAVGISGSGPYSFVMPGMDAQIAAEFASSAKELSAFDFDSWAGTIDESAKTVAVTVPYGTSISGITPTATVSAGADYSPKAAWGSSVSGSAKTYTVIAADGTNADYVVTVTIDPAPVYNIVVTPSSNGMVAADIGGVAATGAMAGETVTLTSSADGGYGLKPGTLQVNETTSGAPVTLNGFGPYSFVMPAADITVIAEFVSIVSYAASRGTTLYTSLQDAIDAAPVGSAGSPDQIILLKSITLPEGAETTYTISKHIRLVSGGSGTNTITRKNTFTNGSLFTVNSGASLTLDGSPNALVIDGNNVLATAALITVNGGTLNMYDGVTLCNNRNTNTATIHGGGARVVNGGSFTMSGGTISGNTAGGNGSGVYVYGTSSRFEMQGGIIGGSDLAKNTAGNNGGGVYVGNGGSFALSGAAEIAGNTAVNGGGVMVSGGASFVMTAGSITENTATSSGGGVDISVASFTMTAGFITGNKALNGGGVCIVGGSNPAQFDMQGGSITGNSASSNGGGAHISGTDSLFKIQGGTIGGTGEANTATGSGGGVYVANPGVFAMSGAASLIGNGVHVFGTITMEGGARVIDEWVYLASGTVITLKGPMTGTAPVAVIHPAVTTPGTPVLTGTGTLVEDHEAKFDLYISSTTYSGASNRIDSAGEITP